MAGGNEALGGGENGVSQVVINVPCDTTTRKAPNPSEDESQREHRCHREQHRSDGLGMCTEDVVIDAVALDERRDLLGCHRDDRGSKGQDHHSAMRPPNWPHPAQPTSGLNTARRRGSDRLTQVSRDAKNSSPTCAKADTNHLGPGPSRSELGSESNYRLS